MPPPFALYMIFNSYSRGLTTYNVSAYLMVCYSIRISCFAGMDYKTGLLFGYGLFYRPLF